MPKPFLIPASRIVVIMPNWLGDGVMATPFLRALRTLYPNAYIAAVTRPLVAPVLAGLACINETFITKKGEESQAHSWLKQNHFDLGISLPNSFRAAWLLWRAGIKHRLGYAREWRSPLLTDRLPALRRTLNTHRIYKAHAIGRKLIQRWERYTTMGVRPHHIQVTPSPVDLRTYTIAFAVNNCGEELPMRSRDNRRFDPRARFPFLRDFEPVPTIEYYLKLAEYLGAPPDADKHMQLAITDTERTEADRILAQIGIETPTQNSEFRIQNSYVVLVPGANFGSSKCWPPERFAEVARRLITERHVHVLLASSPAELPIIDAILQHAFQNSEFRIQNSLHALAKLNDGRGLSLGALKEIVRRSTLMLCNDTGPRHFAAAFDIPCVTLFGPTDPVWAETWHPKEKIVRIDVPCGPCQLKKCPIDHRCMNGIDVDMVIQAVASLWPSE